MDLTLLLTEACNLRCRYCYLPAYPRTVMSKATAVAAIRQAIAHGTDSLSLTFFGGEPLLQADTLFEILAEARELERRHGVMITAKTSTNGLLLDDRILKNAAALRLFISLSMDGDREAHDTGRVQANGRGSFDAVDAALGKLLARNRPFAVYSVVTPDNVRHFDRGRKYLWRRGARLLVSAVDYGGAWTRESIRELERQYERVGRMYERLMKSGQGFHLEPFDNRIAARTRAEDFDRCAPGVRQVTVAPDGTLYGCVEFAYRRMNPIGTADHWLDPAEVEAFTRQLGSRPSECGGCGIRERCTNGCACVNLRTTGRADRPPTSLCLTEQSAVLASDRIAARLYKKRVPEFLLRHYSSSYHLLSGLEQYVESTELEPSHPSAPGVPP